jgi:zinc metalloprotease ZmpA
VQKTVDITGQAGGTVSLKFTGTENNALQTTFALDDLALTVT